MRRATVSLPVPCSPKIKTGTLSCATDSICRRIFCMARDVPINACPEIFLSPFECASIMGADICAVSRFGTASNFADLIGLVR